MVACKEADLLFSRDCVLNKVDFLLFVSLKCDILVSECQAERQLFRTGFTVVTMGVVNWS